jgi:cell shape-determining protein MreC
MRNGEIQEEIPGGSFSYLRADVFSRYPFNDRQLLTINAGTDHGVREGMPVVAREHVLIGRVKSVQRTQSEIETIQNSSWKSTVALGPSRLQAILHGGIPPRVELIPAGAEVREGDEIVSISPEFPFDLFLGTIASLNTDSKTLWQSGDVTLPYDGADQLNSVFVVIDFP